MTSTDSKLLMLGLRGSGKTTFLAALWHYLESGEVGDRLTLPQLQPDRDYLNSVRNSWLALKPVGRTSLRAGASVSLSLRDQVVQAGIQISIPDLSGESFRLQWSTRKAPRTYVDLARECSGAFLFIHPNDVKKTHPIKATSDASGKVDEKEVAKISPSANWSPEQTSTQVQLVDILQLLFGMREIEMPMRLAVIISAWDTVRARISPVGWLEGRLPLLSQFLRANHNRMASEIFGISAQGGDLAKDRDRLLKNSTPSARCYAIQGDSLDAVGITAPLQFLLNVNRS